MVKFKGRCVPIAQDEPEGAGKNEAEPDFLSQSHNGQNKVCHLLGKSGVEMWKQHCCQ